MPNTDGTIQLQPGAGYTLFAHAEHLHMTVSKLLTGRDMPLTNIEMALTHTYHLARAKLEKAHKKRR